MSNEMEFFSFLLQKYAQYKNTTADLVLQKWDELGITDYIYNMYEMYHIESLSNAFADIDMLTNKKEGLYKK
ncbi:MAG: DUF3791 domain-containing protein [Spirochaetia bacterium]|nr:DUF3791 domain-containing protein [Spirochaetia bacterium]MBQ3713147.1 DUF3791 domain-containing protein [Spirochaetia bacterium]MBQ6674328.1 DUF3791 domain-containing protein [Spirochaetia bacterium]MBR0319404.1 DUF3791 domain-containing protein [Spirochaetia bacterium]